LTLVTAFSTLPQAVGSYLWTAPILSTPAEIAIANPYLTPSSFSAISRAALNSSKITAKLLASLVNGVSANLP